MISGKYSKAISVIAQVAQKNDGYYVQIQEMVPIRTPFTDYCSSVWETNANQTPSWAVLPKSPEQLNTNKQLFYLAGQMISSGVVNATGCPAGGMEDTSPNGCGMEAANNAMIAWQNQFDFDIWWSGFQYGIPPYMLKALIENESQFWPESSRYYLDEYGLAQI